MVNLRPALLTKARDLQGRKNGRGSIPEEYVGFLELLPLALKNHVQTESRRSGEKACVNEMMDVLSCLQK